LSGPARTDPIARTANDWLDEGRAGIGVLVAPLGASTGVAFERICILGMVEGSLPSRLGADPLASGGVEHADRLGRARAPALRRASLIPERSVECWRQGVALLSFSRTDGASRTSHPSQ
jgi:hypothetical protein